MVPKMNLGTEFLVNSASLEPCLLGASKIALEHGIKTNCRDIARDILSTHQAMLRGRDFAQGLSRALFQDRISPFSVFTSSDFAQAQHVYCGEPRKDYSHSCHHTVQLKEKQRCTACGAERFHESNFKSV